MGKTERRVGYVQQKTVHRLRNGGSCRGGLAARVRTGLGTARRLIGQAKRVSLQHRLEWVNVRMFELRVETTRTTDKINMPSQQFKMIFPRLDDALINELTYLG